MPYTYTSFQQALALWMAVPQANISSPNFVAALPSIIDYAEDRCYNELDLIFASEAAVFPMTPLVRGQSYLDASALPAPTGLQLITVEELGTLPPSWAPGQPAPIDLRPCFPVSLDYLNFIYPMVVGRPERFFVRDSGVIDFGPAPDQAYFFFARGKVRPTPLYAAAPNDGTQTTYLTTTFPALFLAAAMISAAGYQKNFGAQADDPRMAMSWETQFGSLLGPAKEIAMRQRQHGWQALSADRNPPPTPPTPPGG